MPKPTVKPTESTKGPSEKEKAARAKTLEKLAAPVVKLFQAHKEREEATQASLLGIATHMRDIRKEEELSRDECRAILKSALADVYCGGKTDEVSMEGDSTAYTLLSKFVAISSPKDAKVDKEVEKALAKDVGFGDLYKVATGNKKANEVNKKGKHGGKRNAGKSNAIDDADTFSNLFSALVGRAWNGETKEGKTVSEKFEGSLNLGEIEDAVTEILAGYESNAEQAAEADTKD